jgi:hypothetical protein
MTFPLDSRRSWSSDFRTTSKPDLASDQDMSVGGVRKHAARILVVDDNPGIAKLMSQLLVMRGYPI